ncbi:acetate--CoA ligase family protein [Cypionkella sp.]|uniref:acetate--CoA ligase family protein n=1 Tax=Cypionkella sp. TaxID=2811411 RepID=UPI0027237393|nr:acetate--CoA ligase family protein [Cypionkella sp.]MDO8983682.1 acetate--CoA ligase family protein [Cypionkella sp.]MDP2050083.1 acetate--CoA ligase family protein [Cypionkella sp.]
MTTKRSENLRRLLSPRHIAFVGGRDAEVAIHEAERIGFQGQIWPVNPRRETLAGYRCYPSVDDLPEAPDGCFLAVPAAAAIATTAKLAARGAGGIVCYTAGFREAGSVGAALEADLIKAAGDLALVGPNCYGVINYLDRAAMWPFAHGGGAPGYGAAIITQSGMLSSDITMSQRSLPLTHMISCGNQSVLSLEDFVDHLIDHPAVRAIGMHIEGLRDVPRFAAVALRAVQKGIPLVALKTGSSQIGASLTVSHTGSLSGTDDLYDALFVRVGVIRVNSPAQLLETLKFLCVAGAPSGNRIAGFTCSGGGATMLADHAETIGLGFPAFPDAAHTTLTTLLPDIATVSNPLDYTTPIWGDPARTGPVFRAAIDGLSADATLLVQDYPAAGLDESKGFYRADASAFIAAAQARGIPAAICATLPENIDAETRTWLVSQGIAPMQGLTEALNAIRSAVLWSARRAQILQAPPDLLHTPPANAAIKVLDEAEGKDHLRQLGLPIPQGEVVSAAGIIAAAARVGYPLVLKMMGARLAHKSEAGAVAIGLDTTAALSQALDKMCADVLRHDPLAVTDRFLVERMAPRPLAELLVNLRRDAQFGLILTLGAGGVLVELLNDAETLLLPTTETDILHALSRLKISPLLTGFRGAAAADMPALAGFLAQLATTFEANAHSLTEIEINPLFVTPAGVWVVDALIQSAVQP